ncbi:DUF4150 domain-containing protein [Tateyamaria omphalii]|uniref:DUF4150 domain-containing protein n=1 Tax=Tateyamaria omphalii TaxID=299262 RepID=UPI001C99126A|nr:DUF4150 domain-containing protein [Tateyamaria omphalii]MBY5931936.1 DUF4150 domain-containing protein [Tateyamaria omphalii]
MTVTIRVNGLTITHRGSGGTHSNSVPDVCRTPGKGRPVPYAITAVNPDIVKGTTTVHADGGNMIANRPSEFSRCSGDEAGSMNGVSSGTHLKQSNWITYSPNVYMEGENVCRLTDKLFMNNRNCISGQGGQVERVFDTGDPVLDALCEIFCEVREEWQECRRRHGPGSRQCTRPSRMARDRTRAALEQPNSRLNRANRRRFPGGIGAAERSVFVPRDANNPFDRSRRAYNERGMRDAIERMVRRQIREHGLDALRRAGRRWWMRFVPGLNILGGVLDVIEGAQTAAEIYQAIRNASSLLDDAVRIVPDYSVVNENGAIEGVYDYKFDAPGYQDELGPSQENLYRRNTSGEVIEVSNSPDSCNCDRQNARPIG